MKKTKYIIGTALMAITLFTSCGGQESNSSDSSIPKEESSGGLSDFEIKNGIGPVDEPIIIDKVNQSLADKGAQIFKTKCSACHKMSDRYVGPPLGKVLDNRTPTYVMNMILNPAQMVKEHPEAKKLLAEYMTPMPNQNLTQDEARAVVEYLQTEQIEKASNQY